jgi:hypothetical protein
MTIAASTVLLWLCFAAGCTLTALVIWVDGGHS